MNMNVTLSDWNIVLEVSNSSASSLSLLKQVEAWSVVTQAPHSADLELPHLFPVLTLTPRTATPMRGPVAVQIPGNWPNCGPMFIKIHPMGRDC